jgi:hypothetical protein
MSWVVDHAALFYFVFALLAVGFGAAWYTTRKPAFLAGALAAVGLAALVFLLTRLVDTDSRQIERNLRAMADGMEESPPRRVFELISKKFQSQFVVRGAAATWDYRQICDAATRATQTRHVRGVVIQDFEITSLTGSEAVVVFRARPVLADSFAPFFPCEARFVREEDGVWRMIALKVGQPSEDPNKPFSLPG